MKNECKKCICVNNWGSASCKCVCHKPQEVSKCCGAVKDYRGDGGNLEICSNCLRAFKPQEDREEINKDNWEEHYPIPKEEVKEERNCDGCKLFGKIGVHSFTCPIRKEKIEIEVKESDWESDLETKQLKEIVDFIKRCPVEGSCNNCYTLINNYTTRTKLQQKQDLLKELEVGAKEFEEKQVCSPMHTIVKEGGSKICHQCSSIGGNNLAIYKVLALIKSKKQ